MYVIPDEEVQPGTLIKVTPDSEAPIIPKLTKSQLAFLLALKKVALDAPRDVK
jgi:hypothetical protein